MNKSKIMVGFLDLLTGFLASAISLMLIFSYSINQGGQIAGAPKDYVYYQLKVPGPEYQMQIFAKQPNGKLIELVLDPNGEYQRDENGFINLKNNEEYKFSAWGPVKKLNGSGRPTEDAVYYNLYGATRQDEGNWEFSVLYYNHQKLDDQAYLNLDAQQIQGYLSESVTVTQSVFTTNIKKDTTLSIQMGELKTFTLSTKADQ